jgi:hypothetical protein
VLGGHETDSQFPQTFNTRWAFKSKAKMHLRLSFLFIALGFGGVQAVDSPYAPKKGGCPPLKDEFVIHQYQLYPENADFDYRSCLLYTG